MSINDHDDQQGPHITNMDLRHIVNSLMKRAREETGDDKMCPQDIQVSWQQNSLESIMENQMIPLSSIRLEVQRDPRSQYGVRKTLHYTLCWLHDEGPGKYPRVIEEGPHGDVPLEESVSTFLLAQLCNRNLIPLHPAQISNGSRPFEFSMPLEKLESQDDLLQCLQAATEATQAIVPDGLTVGQCLRRYEDEASTVPRPFEDIVAQFYTHLAAERAKHGKITLYCKFFDGLPLSEAESHSARKQYLEETLSRCGYLQVHRLRFQLPPMHLRRRQIASLVGSRCEIFRIKSRRELNGKRCSVKAYVPKDDRYVVRIDNTKEKIKLRSYNLKKA